MSVIVKICGLTGSGDVSAAIDAGADALGFVIAESKRRVSAEHAAEISRRVPAGVLRVAVMQHPTQDQWREVARVFRPDVLQTDAADFERLEVSEDIERWPVFREGDAGQFEAAHGMFVYEGQRSGQGETVDWRCAARLARTGRMILAGGLGPHNVAEAVRTVRPYGVDASSSLESAPGRKSAKKMTAYVAAAKNLGSK